MVRLVLSALFLVCVAGCFRVYYIHDGILILNGNNTYTQLVTNISSCQQCLCYAFQNNSYLGLNCFTSNRTCVLFRNYRGTWSIQSDINSTFWFIQPEEMPLTTLSNATYSTNSSSTSLISRPNPTICQLDFS
ncbi:unnamed protein product, partial [Didymodactylos carnosus]